LCKTVVWELGSMMILVIIFKQEKGYDKVILCRLFFLT
jgi:hypothetical protein